MELSQLQPTMPKRRAAPAPATDDASDSDDAPEAGACSSFSSPSSARGPASAPPLLLARES